MNDLKTTKLTPFHKFNKMFYWLSHTYPYEMNVCVGLQGTLDIETLKEALKDIFLNTKNLQTRIKHCLFFTKRVYKKESKKFDINTLFTVEMNVKDDPGGIDSKLDNKTVAFLNDAIDLETEPPVKFYLAFKNKKEPVFFLKLHHTVSDAEGAYFLITKIFQQYNRLLNEKTVITLPEEPIQFSLDPLKHMIPDTYDEKKEFEEKSITASFFKDSSAKEGIIKCIPFILNKNEFQSIKNISKETKYTINDILVSVVILATHDMIKKRKITVSPLRIEQLVNLRQLLNIRGGLSNFICAFSTLVLTNELAPVDKLIDTVHRKTKKTLEEKNYLRELLKILSIKFLTTKKLARLTKQSEAYLCKNNYSFFSATVSNPGRLDGLMENPYKCKINYMWGAMHPNPTFGTKWISHTINNNVTMNFIYADPIITEDTAKEMVDLFKSSLKKIITSKDKIIKKGSKT